MYRQIVLTGMALALTLMLGNPLRAQEAGAVPDGAGAIQQGEAQTVKNPVAQLRGKLLYKNNQARRMERAALEADGELKRKIEALQSQIEALYVEANPQLAAIYAEQKQLGERIEALNQK